MTMVYPCLSLYCTLLCVPTFHSSISIPFPLESEFLRDISVKCLNLDMIISVPIKPLLSLDKYNTSNFYTKTDFYLISPYLYSVLTTNNEKLLLPIICHAQHFLRSMIYFMSNRQLTSYITN